MIRNSLANGFSADTREAAVNANTKNLRLQGVAVLLMARFAHKFTRSGNKVYLRRAPETHGLKSAWWRIQDVFIVPGRIVREAQRTGAVAEGERGGRCLWLLSPGWWPQPGKAFAVTTQAEQLLYFLLGTDETKSTLVCSLLHQGGNCLVVSL